MATENNGNGNGALHFDFNNNPTWRIFRIMSEFVEGFTFLAQIPKSVTFFGSARLPEGHRYAQMAYSLAYCLAERGYAVVTGGGPGIMEAANHGAFEAGGMSVGLNIQLPMEQRINQFVTHGTSFSYFFSRKVMLDFSAEAYIFFPGGYGTLDEFFELITLIQTDKVDRNVPVVLMGTDYWTPLIDWMRAQMLHHLNAIGEEDLELWTLTDNIDEVVAIVDSKLTPTNTAKGRRRKTPDEKLQQATRPMTGREQ
jgi:uncharacterized protein (TIGR00730 family)